MTSRTAWIGFVVAVVALVLIGCGGGDDDGKSGVEFGSGELPSTVPEDFPLPPEAVISGTLIDWNQGRTEVNMIFPAGMAASATFFDENLPNRGYVVDSSAGSEESWRITFDNDDVNGEITLRPQSETSTLVTVDLLSSEP